jgi:hypothetical protein
MEPILLDLPKVGSRLLVDLFRELAQLGAESGGDGRLLLELRL